MMMGVMYQRGESREVVRPIATAWLKMKNACILCNIIEIIWPRKNQQKNKFFDIFLTQSFILSTLAQMESPITYKPYLNEEPHDIHIQF